MSIGYLLSDDLMFTSRVTGTARDLNLTLKPARSVGVLWELIQAETPTLVIVDLANPGLEIGDLVARLRQAASTLPRLVAYGSHVDTATLKRARDAGCDVVLPRSKFVQELAAALPVWFGH